MCEHPANPAIKIVGLLIGPLLVARDVGILKLLAHVVRVRLLYLQNIEALFANHQSSVGACSSLIFVCIRDRAPRRAPRTVRHDTSSSDGRILAAHALPISRIAAAHTKFPRSKHKWVNHLLGRRRLCRSNLPRRRAPTSTAFRHSAQKKVASDLTQRSPVQAKGG